MTFSPVSLPPLDDRELPVFVRFIMGRIFPDWSPLRLGIGPNLLYEAVAYVVGKKKEAIVRAVSSEGDVGRAVEILLAGKEQTSFFTDEMTIGDVYRECEAIATSEGKKSQREKLLAVQEALREREATGRQVPGTAHPGGAAGSVSAKGTSGTRLRRPSPWIPRRSIMPTRP